MIVKENRLNDLILFVNDEYLEVRLPEQIPFNDNLFPDENAENILYFHIDEVEATPSKRILELLELVNLFHIDKKQFLERCSITIV